MHGIPQAEVEAALLRIQEEFDWARRTERFEVIDSWQRSRSLASFYRVLGAPLDLQFVAKTGVGWSAQDAEELYLAMLDLCLLLELAEIEGAGCIPPLGWSSSPPLVVMPFVNAEEFRSVIRRELEIQPLFDPMRRAGAMLAAYHDAHVTCGRSDRSYAWSDALAVASRIPRGTRRATALLEEVGYRTAFRYGDVTPNNMLHTPEGQLLMVDPPTAFEPALIHRDIGNFLFQLGKILAVRGVTDVPHRNGYTDLRAAFLDGYQDATLAFGEADHSLIALFEFRRALGEVRKRLWKRPGKAIWFATQTIDRALRFLDHGTL